jgi:putative ABC transport system permease protein
MSWNKRVSSFFRQKKLSEEIAGELQFHIEMRIQEKIAAGLPPDEARRQVLLRFGNTTLVQEDTRKMDIIGWMETLWQDLRQAARMLHRATGFTAVAILSLALGIGLNSSLFSVMCAFVLPIFPYKNAQAILNVEKLDPQHPDGTRVSLADFADWRSQNTSFEEMAAVESTTLNSSGAAGPAERLLGLRTTSNFFSFLGVTPVMGRHFRPDENQAGRDHVAILGFGYWDRKYNRAPDVLGKQLKLNDEFYTIVGVVPSWFHWLGYRNTTCGDPLGEEAHCLDVYVPLAIDVANLAGSARGNGTLTVLGRLKPQMPLERARAEMRTLSARLAKQYPETNKDSSVLIRPLNQSLGRPLAPGWITMQAAVAFVLLIACANVANLLLARGTVRQREIALRCALGASRRRVVRQLFTEGLLLAALAGTLGLLFAIWGAPLIATVASLNLLDLHLDWRVLSFTTSATLATALIFALIPALQASKPDTNEVLKEGGKSSLGSRSTRLRSSLVVIQIGLALVLLIGAGLLIQSFANNSRVNPGFNPHNMLVVRIPFASQKYQELAKRVDFLRRSLEKVQAVPGVRSAAIVTWPPLWGSDRVRVAKEGDPTPPSEWTQIRGYRAATTDYFQTLGLQVIRGRNFRKSDYGSPVAIINETLARLFLPNQDPIGKHLILSTRPTDSTSPRIASVEIIGIMPPTADGNFTNLNQPQLVELKQTLDGSPWFIVRTESNPMAVVNNLRRAVQAIDPDQPLAALQTMDDPIAGQLSEVAAGMKLLAAFAALALLLSALGIYGVIAYFLTQRRHEVGIRMALGAGRQEVLRLILGQALKLAIVGVGLGLFVAWGVTRSLSAALFGISPTDLATFATAAAVLFVIAVLAAYIPATRATKIDPMIALRYE